MALRLVDDRPLRSMSSWDLSSPSHASEEPSLQAYVLTVDNPIIESVRTKEATALVLGYDEYSGN